MTKQEKQLIETVRNALVNYGTWRMQKPRRERALVALQEIHDLLETSQLADDQQTVTEAWFIAKRVLESARGGLMTISQELQEIAERLRQMAALDLPSSEDIVLNEAADEVLAVALAMERREQGSGFDD
jgi:hypothetical protein